MMKAVIIVGFYLFCCANAGSAQGPMVFAGGIVQGASFCPGNGSGAGVAPGSIVAIFGAALASEPLTVQGLPLPLSLGGTDVRFGGAQAPLFYVSPGQINVQVPWDVAAGTVPVVVRNAAGEGAPVTVRVLAAAPGIFTRSQSGIGRGVVQNFVAAGNTPENDLQSAAKPGQTVIVYFTGGGSVDPLPAPGTAGSGQPAIAAVTATVGGRTVTADFAGLVPGFAGLYQANLRLPIDLPEGCYVPIQLHVVGADSNMVTLAVANSGDCSTAKTGSIPLLPGNPTGTVSLERALSVNVATGEIKRPISDTLMAQFWKVNYVSAVPEGGHPPVGAGCITSLIRSEGTPAVGTALLDARYLRAGQLTLNGSGKTWTFDSQNSFSSYYYGSLGDNALAPGVWSLSGTAGADVGSFGPVQLSIDALFSVNFGFTGQSFSRSAPLVVSWTCPAPASGAQVNLYLSSYNRDSKLLGSLYCSASCQSASMTIGRDLLGILPASTAGDANIGVFLRDDRFRAAFTAGGIASGSFTYNDSVALSGATLTQ